MRWIWIVLLIVIPGTALGQQAITSPHGDLQVACETCHTAEGWSPVRLDQFEHSGTGFDLSHAHTGLQCLDCHSSLEFSVAEPGCGSCHSDVHLGELGSDCDRCHTTRTFIDMAKQRDLHREASFALTGAHAGADCQSCHVPRDLGDLQYLGTTAECYDCHQNEYLATTDPDHVQGEFIEDCEACHSTSIWENAFFNHEVQLAGTAVICVDCHQDDYDRAENPDHIAAGFPLDCERCHNTRSWYGEYFEHDRDYFPIFSGRHADEWDNCNECHPSGGTFDQFTCLTCHPHSDRQKTDDQHKEEDTYAYDSIECLRCHPDGRSE